VCPDNPHNPPLYFLGHYSPATGKFDMDRASGGSASICLFFVYALLHASFASSFFKLFQYQPLTSWFDMAHVSWATQQAGWVQSHAGRINILQGCNPGTTCPAAVTPCRPPHAGPGWWVPGEHLLRTQRADQRPARWVRGAGGYLCY